MSYRARELKERLNSDDPEESNEALKEAVEFLLQEIIDEEQIKRERQQQGYED